MKRQNLIFMLCLAVLFLSLSVVRPEAYTLPDTGQKNCYDAAGTIISCTDAAVAGQDGAYNINPMSYKDNGNGTITDNVTGLVWQKEDDNIARNWAAAGTYCDGLNLGGQAGWRLPAKKELLTLVDYSIPHPGPTINASFFTNTNTSSLTFATVQPDKVAYWTSTPDANSTVRDATINGIENLYWVVGFGGGYVSSSYRADYGGFVRCVRGGKTAPSFVNNGDGTITDRVTGLMWQQKKQGPMPWVSALSSCESLSLGQDPFLRHDDWRLPNIKELESIADDNIVYPAIDTNYFYYVPSEHAYVYWSSTTYAGLAENAWTMSFSYGYLGYNLKTDSNYVRCVRGGQAIAAGGVQKSPAASVSKKLVVHIPVLTHKGLYYWTDLQYNADNSTLTVLAAGIVTDLSPYSKGAVSSLSEDYKLQIPVVMINEVSYWLDLQYNGFVYVITGAGQN